ncbi:MAG: tetratricopeptide repeat protein, partial [Gemmatimonadetes bacterium]|nr:tetratricopeptide repeat protein [Gemmatimonadota bacterium]
AAEASAEVVGLEGESESAAGVPEPIEDVAATGAEPFETAPAAPAAEVPAPAVEAPEVMVASGEGAEPVPAPGDEVGLVAPPEPPPETCAEPTAEPPGESFEPPVPEPTAEAAAVPEADTAAPPPAGEEPATGAVAPALDEPEAVPQFEETAGTAGPEQPSAGAEPASPPPVAESPAEAAAAPEAGPWTDAGGEPGAPESVTEGADATRAAAESELMVEAVFEAPAESPPALPELTPLGDLLSPAEAAQPPAATEAVAGLYTETMAELYRSQGFSERAAEVYRWLLARDPDNARLQALLADVGAGPASAVAAPAQRPWQPDVHAVESAFTGAAGAAAEAHTPYAWSGAGEEPAQAGPTIGAYFRQLLAWRPAAAAVPSSELLLEEVVLEPAAPEPVAPEVAAELQDVMPWELATVTEPPDAAASEAMAPDVDRAGPVAEAVPEEVPFQLLDDVTAEAPGAGAPGGEVEAEDEDLEMFRSWLQSLKK